MARQKYRILSKIDAGGMAEVWKGIATSMRGFDKPCAIKRVLPHLSENGKFLAMFLDEARLSLHLSHANIVSTFDIGRSKDAYFIVMEWIDGVNMKSILGIAKEQGFQIPREQAIYIAAEMCKGLHHAHQRRDIRGKPLNIVHRDISPPNVLISREGEVKLVDFGLAKAATQISQTDPGVVKGKYGYLSPEAAYGNPVDARADIFSTGIVLWETLTGQRLFEGKDDLSTVQLVRAAQVPPLRQFNRACDKKLEALVLKALARDPRQRFQTAEEMGQALTRYLFSAHLPVTSYDIAALTKKVMAAKDGSRSLSTASKASGEARLEAHVQAEIDEFKSVEALERQEFRSVAEENRNSPVQDKSSEDPRDWALELGVSSGEETIVDVPVDVATEFPVERAKWEARQRANRLAAQATEPDPVPPHHTPSSAIFRRRSTAPPKTSPTTDPAEGQETGAESESKKDGLLNKLWDRWRPKER